MLVAMPESLRRSVNGAVLLPDDPDFAAMTHGFNLAVAQRPDVVVAPVRADDVVRAVAFAVDGGLPIAVQATGHGAVVPADGGLLVNTSAMSAVRIDPERGTATVGAGARWQQVIDAAGPHGLAPLNGSSTTVGVVGYTLGGGMGPMARTFGFAADHVRRVQLVTADGVVRDVTEESDPDLFWALRGGKVGLGVVTEMTVELAELSTIYGGGLFYEGSENIETALHAWIDWLPGLTETATTSVALLRMPDLPDLPEPLRGRTLLHVRFAYPGTESDGARLLAPMRSAAVPYLDAVGQMPMTAIGSIHNDPAEPAPSWTHGAMLTGFDHELASLLLDRLGPDAESPFLAVEVRNVGGRLGFDTPTGTAVGGREAAFILTLITVGPLAFQPHVPIAASDAMLTAAADWLAPVTNINFGGDPTNPEVLAGSWHPDIAERLASVRTTYDPNSVLAR